MENKQKHITCLLLLILFLSVLIIKSLQHYCFQTTAADLSIFDNVLSNTIKGNFMYSDVIRKHFLSEHFSLIFLLFVPFYYIYDSTYWLFAIQAFFTSLTFYLLFKIATHYKISFFYAIVIALFCTLSRSMTRGLMFDFHHELLVVPLGLLFILSYLKENKRNMLLSAILILFIKEDMALVLLGLSALMAFQNKKMRCFNLSVSAISIVYFFIVVLFFMPQLAPEGEKMGHFITGRWGHFGQTPLEAGINLILSPIVILKSIAWGYARIDYSIVTLAIFSPLNMFASLPYVILHSTASFDIESKLALHYAFGALPALFWATITSYKKFLDYFEGRQKIINVACAALIFNIFCCCSLRFSAPAFGHINTLYKVIDMIPEDAYVSAQSSIHPHLRHVKGRELYPYIDRIGKTPYYIILDKQLFMFPLEKDDFDLDVQKIKTSPTWSTLYENDGIFLFKYK